MQRSKIEQLMVSRLIIRIDIIRLLYFCVVLRMWGNQEILGVGNRHDNKYSKSVASSTSGRAAARTVTTMRTRSLNKQQEVGVAAAALLLKQARAPGSAGAQ